METIKITSLDEYQHEAIKTKKDMGPAEGNKYCALKICEEAGEVSSLIAKHYYHGKDLDYEKLKEELSDLMWYIACMSHANNIKLSEVANYNIEKLRKRHGEKYNSDFYRK